MANVVWLESIANELTRWEDTPTAAIRGIIAAEVVRASNAYLSFVLVENI